MRTLQSLRHNRQYTYTRSAERWLKLKLTDYNAFKIATLRRGALQQQHTVMKRINQRKNQIMIQLSLFDQTNY